MDNNYCNNTILQICRTCMKEITDASFVYLDCTPAANTQLTIRQKLHSCIPELDLSIVSNAIICSKCANILLSVYEFKKNCLQTEIQINNYIREVQHTSDLNLVEVVRFQQSHIKNLGVEVKMEDLENTVDFRNGDLVCDTTAFNEASECTESFHRDIKNFDREVKIEDFKNEDLICDSTAFNEGSECGESIEAKYLLELPKVEMQNALFNTFDDYNINYDLSTAEEYSDTHNSNIAQNCSSEVTTHQDNRSKNKCRHKAESKLKLILHLKRRTHQNFYQKEIIYKKLPRYQKDLFCYYRCCLCSYLTKYKCLFDFHNRIHLTKKDYKHIKGTNKRKCVKSNNYDKYSFKNGNKSKESKQHFSHGKSIQPNMSANKVEKLFKYSVCEYRSNFKGNLKRHTQLHTGEKPFSCSLCEYQCSQKSTLKKHILIHTGEKPFSCTACDFQCSQKSNLKRHILNHTGEKSFSCSVCEYQCNWISKLKQHVRIHTGEKPFSCSACDFQCSDKSNLKQHIRIHTGEKPFSCFVCECQFSRKNSLKKHVLIHKRKKPFAFSCSACDFQCSKQSSLKRHIVIHTGEKPFSCPVCEHQCNWKSHLKQHMRIHTGEKPFSCTLCEHQFSRKSSLKKHILIHTGEKPFSCSVCEYQCNDKGNLKKHILIHTGEKPFSCSVCEYQCREKQSLQKHMLIHTIVAGKFS